jgi:single-strand DNA-binding protein
MGAQNVNRVVITGNLTKDPETRSLQSGSTVTSLRVAVNGRRKNGQTGQWEDKPNYFDVSVWGAQGENVQRYLTRGSGIAIDGRLDWREWQDQQGNKRQSVDIIADNVQFLGGGQQGQQGGGGGGGNYQAPQNQGYQAPQGGGQQGYQAPQQQAPPTQQGYSGYGQQQGPPPQQQGYQQAAPPQQGTLGYGPPPQSAQPRPHLTDPGEDDIPF